VISLGLTLQRQVDSDVFLMWVGNLRRMPFLGPVYNGRSSYIAQARNIVVQQFLAETEDPSRALLFWDADQVPPVGLGDGTPFLEHVLDLESQNLPAVGMLYFRREQPFEPVAYTRDERARYHHLTLEQMIPKLTVRGCYEVDAVGAGALLIQRRVLEHLQRVKAPRPIFETPMVDVEKEPGLAGLSWTEDTFFCYELQELGYKIWLDTRGESAHIAEIPINARHYLPAHGWMSGRSAEPAARGERRIWLPGE